MPPKVNCASSESSDDSESDHMFDDSDDDSDDGLSREGREIVTVSMAPKLAESETCIPRMRQPRPPAVGPKESTESDHESDHESVGDIARVASARADCVDEVRIDVFQESQRPESGGSPAFPGLRDSTPQRRHTSLQSAIEAHTFPRSIDRASQGPASPSLMRSRCVGGVLRHPLVRLTGQCTKIVLGTGGRPGTLLSTPIGEAVAHHRPLRSSISKSIHAMIRTPSLDARIPSSGDPGNKFLPPRLPQTLFSTRGHRNSDNDSGGDPPSPLLSPRTSKIRSMFLGGGKTEDRTGRGRAGPHRGFGHKLMSSLEVEVGPGDTSVPMGTDNKLLSRVDSQNKYGEGSLNDSASKVQKPRAGSWEQSRARAVSFAKAISLHMGRSDSESTLHSLSPTPRSPRGSRSRRSLSPAAKTFRNSGRPSTPPTVPPLSSQGGEGSGSSSRNAAPALAPAPASSFWPLHLFGRGESAEGELTDLRDDRGSSQTHNSVKRPPMSSKMRKAEDKRWQIETSFKKTLTSPPPRGRSTFGARTGSVLVRRSLGAEARAESDESGPADGAETVEDGVAEMAMRSRANVAFYIRMACLLVLLIPDFTTFLIFQVAWGGPVFLCHTAAAPGQKLQIWHSHLDTGNIIVTSTILALHCWFLVSEIRAKGMERRSGFRAYLSRKRQRGWSNVVWNAIYLVVVLASICMLAVDVAECTKEDADFPKAGRVHRVHSLVHLLRCMCILMLLARLSGTLRTRLQSMVSMNKRRFTAKDQKLDLDLTYICDRLIAMALPCVRDVLYRNDMQMVARFFASRHYGHFAVTNLCNAFEEGGNGNYDQALLYNQVQRLPMHDHNAPFMQTLISFLESAVDFLNESKANVVAVHCRGGKGRTGTFCAALMLWTGCCQSADEAMHLFASRRTRPSTRNPSENWPMQGVDAPCQKRCLKYLESMIYDGVDILERSSLLLTKITLSGMTQGWRNLCVIIEEKGVVVYDSGKAFGALQSTGGLAGYFDLEITIDPILLHNDIVVRVFLVNVNDESRVVGCNGHISLGGSRLQYQPGNESTAIKGRQLAFVSFHTAFHDGDICFTKAEVDGAYQDHDCRFFSPDFSVTLAAVGGSFDEALGMIRLTNPTLTSCFDVSGRLPPALDAMRLEQELDSLMGRMSQEKEVVLQGEAVFDSRNCEAGQLCYVVAGQVSYTPVGPRADRTYGRLRITNCPVMGTVGAGALLGLVEFMLGARGSPFGTMYTAKTETVTIRRFTIQSSMYGPMIPSKTPEVSPKDLDFIFKKTAQVLSSWSASLAAQVQYVTEMNNVKHEYNVGMEMSERARLVKQVMEQYQIPVTEQVLVLCDASMERIGVLEKIQGNLLLFPRWLVFVPSSGQADKEVLSSIKAISHTNLERDKLIISFASESRRSVETLDAPSSVSSRRPGMSRSMSRSMTNLIAGAKSASPSLGPSRRCPEPSAAGSFGGGIVASSGPGVTLGQTGSPYNTGKRRRSVHEEAVDIDSDLSFVFTDGMETAIKVQEVIEKQRQLHSEMEALAPPALLLGGASELANIARMFALLLPEEELSTEDMQALQQLLSPFRRKRYLAGSQIFAEGDLNQVIFFVLAGTVSIRAGSAVLVTMNVGELVGERSFWGQGNRGKSAKMIAETDVEVQWLEYESIEIVCTGRPLVAARVARCLSMCIARRIQGQLNLLQQLETAISSTQDAL